jgi:hypothetical protein
MKGYRQKRASLEARQLNGAITLRLPIGPTLTLLGNRKGTVESMGRLLISRLRTLPVTKFICKKVVCLAWKGLFPYRVPPINSREIKMLESSLSQLETLVGELVEQNRQLLASNSQLSADLRASQDENETLQLSLLEQEEQHGSTAARIQALVERASAVNA